MFIGSVTLNKEGNLILQKHRSKSFLTILKTPNKYTYFNYKAAIQRQYSYISVTNGYIFPSLLITNILFKGADYYS
jgi:hypothetical protein